MVQNDREANQNGSCETPRCLHDCVETFAIGPFDTTWHSVNVSRSELEAAKLVEKERFEVATKEKMRTIIKDEYNEQLLSTEKVRDDDDEEYSLNSGSDSETPEHYE